ncbi:MAG: hypothetical protein U1E84_08620 [Rhodoferax sp.]
MATKQAKSASGSGVSYRWQRVHPALIVGHVLTVKAKREEPMRVHFRQSDMDGACSVHCLASVLVILNLAKAEALTYMASRKYGVPAEVYSEFHNVYFHGCMADDLVERVNRLGLPLKVTARYKDDADLDYFAVRCLSRGDLVMLSFRSVHTRKTHHWALGIGVEGMQSGRDTTVDTVLLLDPSGDEPEFRAFNARMRVQMPSVASQLLRTSPAKPLDWIYDSPEWPAEVVRLTGAVRFQRSDLP